MNFVVLNGGFEAALFILSCSCRKTLINMLKLICSILKMPNNEISSFALHKPVQSYDSLLALLLFVLRSHNILYRMTFLKRNDYYEFFYGRTLKESQERNKLEMKGKQKFNTNTHNLFVFIFFCYFLISFYVKAIKY